MIAGSSKLLSQLALSSKLEFQSGWHLVMAVAPGNGRP
jgi:hypothetical protein